MDRERFEIRRSWAAAVLLLAAAVGGGALASGPAEAYGQTLLEARERFAAGDVEEAVKLFRKAERLTGEPPAELLLDLSNAYSKIGAYKDAEETARRALAVARQLPEQVEAYNRLGVALFAGGQASPPRLEEAVAVFHKVLELSDGELVIARYNLAEALLRLERDEEAVAALEQFIAEAPDNPLVPRARTFIKDPRRARIPLLPEFEAVTLDGRYLTDQDLVGKVVLLDFWATWCGPCRAAVPHLRRVHRRWRDQPFVLLSISVDAREEALRTFIGEEEMVWPQIWDRDRELSGDLFQVRSFPTYILVDHEGVMRLWSSGWSPRLETELERRVGGAIRKAKKAARQED